MSKDPAVLFYTSDFLAGTILMTHEQRGKYILLLCLQRENGHLTESTMLHVCGEYDEMIFAKFKQDENGLYYNERMEEEAEKRTAYSASRSTNRKNHLKNHMSNICNSYDEHMGNGNGNRNINENISIGNDNSTNMEVAAKAPQNNVKSTSKQSQTTANEVNAIEERFNRFWAAYPKKKDKSGARKAWAKLKPSEELMQTMLSSLERQKASPQWQKDDGQFIPYPSTWLNRRRWEDEDETPPTKSAPARYSNYSPEDALSSALQRTYGEAPPRASPDDYIGSNIDELFASALERTYGSS